MCFDESINICAVVPAYQPFDTDDDTRVVVRTQGVPSGFAQSDIFCVNRNNSNSDFFKDSRVKNDYSSLVWLV